jgi:2-keto-3-deoxy-6-phosphogluconate aldolase
MIEAGAIAVGMSSQLVSASLMATRNWRAIVERVRDLLHQLGIRD